MQSKKRVLLIQCSTDSRYADQREMDVDPEGHIHHKSALVPLSCATIAALTPPGYEVDIWDESHRGQIRADTPLGDYDIVGVSVIFSALAYQARFLGLLFGGRGATVVAGGPGVSAAPEDFRDFFDAIFVNEAERTWPEFIRDFENGSVRREYRQIDKPALSESPAPRWDSIAATVSEYTWGAVQTTRGCPFDCEFCDVIYLFGRRQRHKAVEQVVEEVRALEALGVRGIFLADDEFVGNPAHTKQVLSALVPVNGAFRRPLRLFTQATMNLSRDEETLELAADAGFYTVLVGIESFNKDSLRETHKHQNVRKDILGDLRKIQRYGIGLRGNFIVGFDNDGPETFETLYRGVLEAHIPWVVVSPLQAPENTRLWMRLRAENRIVHLRRPPTGEGAMLSLNFVPARMSRTELLEGYRDLAARLYAWDAACERILGWAKAVQRSPRIREEPLSAGACDRFLEEAAEAWGLSEIERAVIGDTLGAARRVAPQLINRVVFFLLRNQFERIRYGRLFASFSHVLEAERQGDLVVDDAPVLIPPAFSSAVQNLFPPLYTRLYRSLPDKSAIPEAAREVLVDFIVRWGATFRGLEPHHEHSLLELCDRAAAKLGGKPMAVGRDEEGALLAEARRSRLVDAVMKDVRDELARIAPARSS